jgi:hypothetical protein
MSYVISYFENSLLLYRKNECIVKLINVHFNAKKTLRINEKAIYNIYMYIYYIQKTVYSKNENENIDGISLN